MAIHSPEDLKRWQSYKRTDCICNISGLASILLLLVALCGFIVSSVK
jgi:hypothetical protein